VLSERRKLVHERAAAAIEGLGPGRVEDQLMEVAHHYSRSGNVGKAVEYLGRAGHRAAQQAAHGEAVDYLTRALDLLPQLPESVERTRQELELGQHLVAMLGVTRGYVAPETIEVTQRVAALAEKSGTLMQLVNSVDSRHTIALVSGDIAAASALADQALDLAVREGSPASLGLAHFLQLQTRYYRGDLAVVEEHFTTGLAFFDAPGFRQLPGVAVMTFGYASWNAWLLGRTDVARDRGAQAMAAADTNNPFDLAWSRVALGQARAHLGRATEGVALIRQGIAGLLEIGFRLGITYYTGALAEAQACAGAVGDALATVEQALQANPGELYWRPENLRLRGALRLTQGQTELAAPDFREAIALARRLGAKALELRATVSLVRLLDQQGHRDEARTMLAQIYDSFTDTSAGGLRSAGGFDTVDLKEAKALLEELR
jgi:tetratricopeptide (TPR) repeat protein